MSLSEFIKEWYDNPKWWFASTDAIDKELSDKYQHLLFQETLQINDILSHAPTKTTTLYILNNHTPKQIVDYIIVFDQLPRHVHRNNPDQVQEFLTKALKLCDMIVNDYSLLQRLTPIQLCFALLPLRHTRIPSRIFSATNIAWWYLNTFKHNDEQYLRKFLKAAYARTPCDQSTLVNTPQLASTATQMVAPSLYFAKILDFSPYEWNKKPTKKLQSSIIDSIRRLVLLYNSNPNHKIIVSLSGGVDSMVLAFVMKQIVPNLSAVHIDYANRSESYMEMQFVHAWCRHLEIPFNHRRITEISRENCMRHGLRSTYETYTRNVRFNTYKAISDTDTIVFLGHNLDDSFENILTNINHRTKYNNLKGMEENSLHQETQITFVRPLLGIQKSQIYEFAKDNNIPYLKDSTVSWSQRGQIRDNVVPVLNKWSNTYDVGFFDLAKNLEQLYDILEDSVNNYILKTTSLPSNPNIKTLEILLTSPIVNNKMFWRQYIAKVTQIHVSTSSLENFLDRLLRLKLRRNFNPNTKSKIVLSKTLHVSITLNTTQFVMHFIQL